MRSSANSRSRLWSRSASMCGERLCSCRSCVYRFNESAERRAPAPRPERASDRAHHRFHCRLGDALPRASCAPRISPSRPPPRSAAAGSRRRDRLPRTPTAPRLVVVFPVALFLVHVGLVRRLRGALRQASRRRTRGRAAYRICRRRGCAAISAARSSGAIGPSREDGGRISVRSTMRRHALVFQRRDQRLADAELGDHLAPCRNPGLGRNVSAAVSTAFCSRGV